MSEDTPPAELPVTENHDPIQPTTTPGEVVPILHIPLTEQVGPAPVADVRPEEPDSYIKNVEKAQEMAVAEDVTRDEHSEKNFMNQNVAAQAGNKAAETAGDIYEVKKQAEKIGKTPEQLMEYMKQNLVALAEYGEKIIENQKKYGEKLAPSQEAFLVLAKFIKKIPELDVDLTYSHETDEPVGIAVEADDGPAFSLRVGSDVDADIQGTTLSFLTDRMTEDEDKGNLWVKESWVVTPFKRLSVDPRRQKGRTSIQTPTGRLSQALYGNVAIEEDSLNIYRVEEDNDISYRLKSRENSGMFRTESNKYRIITAEDVASLEKVIAEVEEEFEA